MGNTVLKLVLLSGDQSQVAYCTMPNRFSDLESAITNAFPEETEKVFRKHWVDQANDKINIANQESYEIFISKATERKIYLEKVKPNSCPRGQSNSQVNSIEKACHVGTNCNECLEAPICGYRYMCIECDNYNICMECEAKMKHSDHIMIRLANPIDSTFSRLVGKIKRAIILPQIEKFHAMMNDLADTDADIPEEQPKAFAPKEQKNVSIVEPLSRSGSANPDYEAIRQLLLEDNEEEKEAAASTDFVASTTSAAHTDPPASAPPVETPQCQVVYHRKKHINDAIIAMMSMGFNNENQWLGHLLESVNGNIGKALSLLKPVKKSED